MGRRANKPNNNRVGNGSGSSAGNVVIVDEPTNLPSGIATTDDNGIDSADFIRSEPTDAVDPNDVDATPDPGTDSGTGTRRRGRPAGSRNRTRKSATQTTATLERILFSLHMGMGMVLGHPEFGLTREESSMLAEAVTGVTELYDIPLADEKTLAWLNLGSVAMMVYGPRVGGAIFRRKRMTIVGRGAQPQQPPPQPIRPQTSSASAKPNGAARVDYDFVPATGGGVNPIENA